MSNPRIEVDVVANVAGVASGVTAATSQLDKLGKAAQATAPKFEQLSKSTSRYNGIGIDFARVIQDAPFGIIGVGNNIQQLAQSFSSLGNAGDSTQSRIKLAFKQIFSSGNLLVLAVSAVTTVLTLYEKGAFKSADATEDLNKKLDDYREKLQGIAKANLEGIKNAQSEIANFKLLQAQAENTNISYEKRIEAVEQLKKQYPEYLKNLTNEQILTGNVGVAYDNLTASIIATAKAKAFQSQIGENALNQATLAAQSEENLVKIKELQIQRAEVLAASEKQSAKDKQDFLTKASALQSNINALEDQNKKNKEESNRLDEQNNKLAGQINEKVSQGANFIKASGKEIDGNKEKLKQYSQGWDDFNLGQETARELQDKLTFGLKDYEKAILSTFQSTQNYPVVPDLTGDNAWDQYAFSVYRFEQAAAEAGNEVRKSANDALEFGKKISSIEGKEVKIKVTTEGLEDDEETGKGLVQSLNDRIAALNKLKEVTSDPASVQKYSAEIKLLQEELNNLTAIPDGLKVKLDDLSFAFQGLGSVIGKAFKNPQLGNFLGQFTQFVAKIIVGAFAVSKANAIAGATQSSLFTGPAAIFTLPAFIATSVGLVASAFAGLKGGGGGGGGARGGGGGGSSQTGTSFTGGGQGGMFEQNRDLNGELVVRGQDLVYVFNQASNRINKG
jgi:hypothetical protein